MDLIEACRDRNLFAPWFKNAAGWQSWLVFLRALFALPMTDEDRSVFEKHTGRVTPSAEPASEAWMIVGRRGGKSFISALVATYVGAERTYVYAVGSDPIETAADACNRQIRCLRRVPRSEPAMVCF